MTLWIFQILLDIVLGLAVLMWLSSRKRIQRLEESLRRMSIRQAREELGAQRSPQKEEQHDTREDLEVDALNQRQAVTEPLVGRGPKKTDIGAMLEASKKQGHLLEPKLKAAQRMSPLYAQHSYSNLLERQVSTSFQQNARFPAMPKASGAEAFEQAQRLLSRGVALNDVAEKTGLSHAELQLLGKVQQKSV